MLEVYRGTFAVKTVLPLLFYAVSAGFPSPADDFVEDEIDLSRLLISNRPATFLVRVRGTSMVEAHLFDGDLPRFPRYSAV
jgi:DNA polymerase V